MNAERHMFGRYRVFTPGAPWKAVASGIARPAVLKPIPTLADLDACKAIARRLILPAPDRKRTPGKRYVCRNDVSWGPAE